VLWYLPRVFASVALLLYRATLKIVISTELATSAVAQGFFWDRLEYCDNRDKSMIRPNIVSRSKIIVKLHFSLTEQRLKVLAKNLLPISERVHHVRVHGIQLCVMMET
jgi:hypothetical protein